MKSSGFSIIRLHISELNEIKMWKVLSLLAFVILVAGDETVKLADNSTKIEIIQIKNASTNSTSTSTTENSKIIPIKVPLKDETADEGSQENPINPLKHAIDDDGSIGNFKYYFVLLAFSSLSVIAIIVFKALRLVLSISSWGNTNENKQFLFHFSRLRKTRAELKYGRANTTDRSEVEPLGRSQWLEESSDENEDELFDINFLKNSRSQSSI